MLKLKINNIELKDFANTEDIHIGNNSIFPIANKKLKEVTFETEIINTISKEFCVPIKFLFGRE